MQEKDIRKQLNQELDTMAPDILNKILAQPMEPVKNERELFGRNKPLFKEKKQWNRSIWAPALTLAACLAIVILVVALRPVWNIKDPAIDPTVTAFRINIDVNPSIDIQVNGEGNVLKVKAANKDAKEIVQTVNAKMAGRKTDYNVAVKYVVKELKKKGYFDKKKKAMLVSVISEDKEAQKDKVAELKKSTKDYMEIKKIQCKAVYQNCETNDKVVKLAEKNDVSEGKASFCMMIAEKEKKDVDKMCQKTIDELVKTAEKNKVTDEDEWFIDDEIDIPETDVAAGLEDVTEPESEEMVSEENEETVTEQQGEEPEDETLNVEETEGATEPPAAVEP